MAISTKLEQDINKFCTCYFRRFSVLHYTMGHLICQKLLCLIMFQTLPFAVNLQLSKPQNWVSKTTHHAGTLDSGGISLCIHNFGIRTKCVVSFTSQLFTPADGLQNCSGWLGEEKIHNFSAVQCTKAYPKVPKLITRTQHDKYHSFLSLDAAVSLSLPVKWVLYTTLSSVLLNTCASSFASHSGDMHWEGRRHTLS
jgi:hypothetical protein